MMKEVIFPYITPIPFNKPIIKPVTKDTITMNAALFAYWFPLTKTLKSKISPKKAKEETANIGPKIVKIQLTDQFLKPKKQMKLLMLINQVQPYF